MTDASAVITRGEGIGEMNFEVHHDVDFVKLIKTVRGNRKNIAQIGRTTGGKLFVKAKISMLHGNVRSALIAMHASIEKQVERANDKARTSTRITV